MLGKLEEAKEVAAQALRQPIQSSGGDDDDADEDGNQALDDDFCGCAQLFHFIIERMSSMTISSLAISIAISVPACSIFGSSGFLAALLASCRLAGILSLHAGNQAWAFLADARSPAHPEIEQFAAKIVQRICYRAFLRSTSLICKSMQMASMGKDKDLIKSANATKGWANLDAEVRAQRVEALGSQAQKGGQARQRDSSRTP